MDFETYRSTEAEKTRIGDLMAMTPSGLKRILDVGARDGFISKQLALRCETVVALDLTMPVIQVDNITCVQGNAAALEFPDSAFDLVFCAEVLEHIDPAVLPRVCNELARVSGKYLLLGVPYRQDIRWGRTTCRSCGAKNPPWGHVNTFDEQSLAEYFSDFDVVKTSFVGQTTNKTNFLSTWLLDLAGNPFGTYSQDEQCVVCNARLMEPPERHWIQRVLTRAGHYVNRGQALFVSPQPNWMHLLLSRK